MALLACTDCHQPVSSEAIAGPTCGRAMRDRTYLTPMAQMGLGAFVLVAGLAWPPLFFIVVLGLIGRLVAGWHVAAPLSAFTAALLLLVLAVGLMYAFPSYAVILAAWGVVGGFVLLRTRLGALTSRADQVG